MQFLEFHLIHTYYSVQNLQLSEFYQSLKVNFQVSGLYDTPHFCADTQYQQAILGKICKLICRLVVGV